MPKYFRERKTKDYRKFLEAHGYSKVNNNGDDEIWALDGCTYTVKIPSRNEDIPMGTSDYIRKMLQKCGFSRKEILKWWEKNGFGL